MDSLFFNLFGVLAGVLALYVGAEFLVKGSSSLSLRLGIPPLVVGLIVAGYGTSTPELIVSLQAALQNHSDIAAGNIVGSNIMNSSLIIGLAALACPIDVNLKLIQVDAPIAVAVSLIFFLLSFDHIISFNEGIFFILCLILYTWFVIYQARKESQQVTQEITEEIPTQTKHWALDILYLVMGLAILIIGAEYFLKSSLQIAKAIGLPDSIIGLTLIAIGTSLPELAVSVLAAIRKHGDLAIGNIVGSNIFNILGIGGVVAIAHPITISGISSIDYLIMIALAIVLIPIMRTGFKVNRLEGAILVICYFIYLTYQFF